MIFFKSLFHFFLRKLIWNPPIGKRKKCNSGRVKKIKLVSPILKKPKRWCRCFEKDFFLEISTRKQTNSERKPFPSSDRSAGSHIFPFVWNYFVLKWTKGWQLRFKQVTYFGSAKMFIPPKASVQNKTKKKAFVIFRKSSVVKCDRESFVDNNTFKYSKDEVGAFFKVGQILEKTFWLVAIIRSQGENVFQAGN